MKRFFTLFFAVVTVITSVFSQNAIVGSGFTNGWGANCTDNTNFVYFTESAGTTYTSGSLTPKATGNQFWRLAVGWSSSYYQINNGSSSDVLVSPGTKYNATVSCTATGALYHNISSTSDRYVFKTLNAGTAPTGTWVFFAVQGTVQTVSSVSSTTSVGTAQSYIVTAELSDALSTGQGVYLRYTNGATNNFNTSTVVAMNVSGTSATYTIPALNTTGTVSYYVFTSGSGLTISATDADLYTINLNNNAGSNYSYSSVVLDASLLDFSANKKTSFTELTWQTASEKDNAQFNIQRSTNNQTWQTIGTVKATNNPSGAKYNFTDDAPLSNINYYRLEMVDRDGKMDYSKVVSVSGKDGKQLLSVYPNPVKAELTLLTDGNTEGGVIYDMTGRIVRQISENSSKVNVQDLPNGVYFVRLLAKNGLASEAVRFVKQ